MQERIRVLVEHIYVVFLSPYILESIAFHLVLKRIDIIVDFKSDDRLFHGISLK